MQAQPDVQDLPSFFVRNPNEATDLLCLFFDVLIQSTLPPVSSQLLHTDLVLRLTRLMQSVFDSCLSENWSIPSESQAAYLIRICSGMRQLPKLQNPSIQKVICGDMVARLLLHRLSNRYTPPEDATLRTLLNEYLDTQEPYVNGRTLAIVSSMSHLGSDDESGIVSTKKRFENTLKRSFCAQELGNDIYLANNSHSQCQHVGRCQVRSVFKRSP